MDEDLKKQLDFLERRLTRIENFLSSFSPFIPTAPGPGEDDLYEDAVKLAKEYEKVSSSLLQRKLQIGFNRAARLLDKLSENKIVEAGFGSKPRRTLVGKDFPKKP